MLGWRSVGGASQRVAGLAFWDCCAWLMAPMAGDLPASWALVLGWLASGDSTVFGFDPFLILSGRVVHTKI
jgi:hypothetical protein